MKWSSHPKQILAGLTMGFLVITGTYNAVVINSESSINGGDIKFAKRLDEVYGVVVSKREVAASISWQKLSIKQAAIAKQKFKADVQKEVQQMASANSASDEVVTQAAVQEELSLGLTEVINPKKWQQGLKNDQFSGNLITNNGVIEALSVALPNGEGLSVSFSEMTGNVFEYDFAGELYSGMMYQVDQTSYMVTLTNGPLEGTKLKFTAEPSFEQTQQQEESQRQLAENADSEVGGNTEPQGEVAQLEQDIPQPEVIQHDAPENQDLMAQQEGQIIRPVDQQIDQPIEQAQGYNFEIQQSM